MDTALRTADSGAQARAGAYLALRRTSNFGLRTSDLGTGREREPHPAILAELGASRELQGLFYLRLL